MGVLDKAAIAELLVRDVGTPAGHRGHEAFIWPEEAAEIAAAGRWLTEMNGIGASLARRIHGWIENAPGSEAPAHR